MTTDWTGKRVTILGGARQGQAAARYLARHGASVTLNDRRVAEEMVSAQAALADLPIRWVLGDHPLSLLETTDVLCISGGIPLSLPLVQEAIRRGLPLTNDTQVFMEAVPCPTIGITGSAGKTTTTTLVGRIARAAFEGGRRRVYVGGNIGDPLLNYVDEMRPDDLAILEISSFQLEQMTLSPNVAVILNITPNHLDRHGTMEAYTAAKARILAYQRAEDIAILGRDDPGAWGLRGQVRGRLLSFGFTPLPEDGEGVFLRKGRICLRAQGKESTLLKQDTIRLRGEHNRLNVMAACAIACAAGLPRRSILAGVQDFGGVPHRLQYVRTYRGAAWYNDSIATAPERTMAAIRSFDEPIILLLGGRDKNLPWEPLAELVARRVEHVIVFGEAAAKIEAVLQQQGGGQTFGLQRCPGLRAAVEAAARLAQPGRVVLLSPGGTSFDEFRDFEERGEAFCKWVLELS
ncbi:MAG: UDP-N-acetylmuramoyl-L-alanine--D-glutamate ligase [Anaerolineales bacterium]